MLAKFLLILVITGATVSVGSLAWPKFTQQNRPPILESVHDIVLGTQIGKNTAAILGVTDEKNIEPINTASIASSMVNSAVGAVEKRAQYIVVQQAVRQLTNQFDELPKDEQKQIQEIICKPPQQ